MAATHLQSTVPIDVEDAVLSISSGRIEARTRFPVDAPRLGVVIHGTGEEGGVVRSVEVIASCTPIGVGRREYDVRVGISRSIVAAFAYEDVGARQCRSCRRESSCWRLTCERGLEQKNVRRFFLPHTGWPNGDGPYGNTLDAIGMRGPSTGWLACVASPGFWCRAMPVLGYMPSVSVDRCGRPM